MRQTATTLRPQKKIGPLLLVLVVAGLLGGCQTDGGPADPFSELAAYHARNRAPSSTAAQANEPPKSRAQIAMDCWALAEKSHASASLDAKGDFVNKCIDGKMKSPDASAAPNAEAPARPKASAKPKPNPGNKPAS